MRSGQGRSIVGILLCSLAGCTGSSTDPDPAQSVELSVEGTVRSALHSEPIAGAQVELGWGGHFSLPTVRQSTETDMEGFFEFTDFLTYSGACPFLWIAVVAEGYETASGLIGGDPQLRVNCQPIPQIFLVMLEPTDG